MTPSPTATTAPPATAWAGLYLVQSSRGRPLALVAAQGRAEAIRAATTGEPATPKAELEAKRVGFAAPGTPAGTVVERLDVFRDRRVDATKTTRPTDPVVVPPELARAADHAVERLAVLGIHGQSVPSRVVLRSREVRFCRFREALCAVFYLAGYTHAQIGAVVGGLHFATVSRAARAARTSAAEGDQDFAEALAVVTATAAEHGVDVGLRPDEPGITADATTSDLTTVAHA